VLRVYRIHYISSICVYAVSIIYNPPSQDSAVAPRHARCNTTDIETRSTAEKRRRGHARTVHRGAGSRVIATITELLFSGPLPGCYRTLDRGDNTEAEVEGRGERMRWRIRKPCRRRREQTEPEGRWVTGSHSLCPRARHITSISRLTTLSLPSSNRTARTQPSPPVGSRNLSSPPLAAAAAPAVSATFLDGSNGSSSSEMEGNFTSSNKPM